MSAPLRESLVAAVVGETRRFAGRELDPARDEREGRISPRALSRARELGLFGLTIPEPWGGLGLSLAEASPVITELAERDRSFATTVGLHVGLGTRAIVELACDSLRDELLPELASGRALAVFAATEPCAGSDLSSIRTTLVERDGALRLSGEKCYVTNGGLASFATVLVRVPGDAGGAGFGLVLVPLDARGVERGREEHKLGLRSSSTTTLRFDDVMLPLRHRLGRPGSGLADAQRALHWGRSLMSAGCIGTGRAALAAAWTHASLRMQFGRPLATFESVRSRLARMAVMLFAAERVVARIGVAEARGDDLALASTVAKVVSSEAAFALADDAIQVHGGAGFIEDTGVARLLRDCRVTRIFEGANDVLRVHLGTRLLVAPRADRELITEHPRADVEAQRTALVGALASMRTRLGARAARHQLALETLGRARVALEIAFATGAPDDDAPTVARARANALAEVAASLDRLPHTEEDTEDDSAVLEALELRMRPFGAGSTTPRPFLGGAPERGALA